MLYFRIEFPAFDSKGSQLFTLPNNRLASKNFEDDSNGSQVFADHGSNPIKENENKGVRSKEVRWAEQRDFGTWTP